jgi:hypothetical protein
MEHATHHACQRARSHVQGHGIWQSRKHLGTHIIRAHQ